VFVVRLEQIEAVYLAKKIFLLFKFQKAQKNETFCKSIEITQLIDKKKNNLL
jgi:hypothetical protein